MAGSSLQLGQTESKTSRIWKYGDSLGIYGLRSIAYVAVIQEMKHPD